ncbi:MAG: DNA-directed RNA polymerase subunit omega [Clostridia bacterium]|nr:DNA-directed RNA polymerase subunit omega [Clostridia bacterium]
MLSKPNVNDLMEKAGNRYEAVIAIAKRARQIERRRIEREDPCIDDSVDVASKEICQQKAFVKKNGEYVCPIKDEEVDINTVISETVDGILKDLAIDTEPEEEEEATVTENSKDSNAIKIVDEKKTKIKKVTKGKKNE